MHVLALDLGGTKLAVAIIDKSGRMVQKQVNLLEGRQGREVGSLIGDTAGDMLQRAAEAGISIRAVGVSVPGIYRPEKGTVWAPNIPGWDDYPLKAEMSGLLGDRGISPAIDSDRACYILGETWLGAARGCRDAIFIAVGTGIGAGIMVEGRILRGHRDIAGAIGWMALDRPFRSQFVNVGCFEHYASGPGIAKVTRELLEEASIGPSVLGELSPEEISSHDVFEAFNAGDPLAIHVVNQCVEFWGMATANLVSIFNPRKIIFGGGIFGPAGNLIEAIRVAAEKWAQPISVRQVSIGVSTLGADAGLLGAGRLAFLTSSEN